MVAMVGVVLLVGPHAASVARAQALPGEDAPAAMQLDALWEQLGAEETADGFSAIWALSDAPRTAVPYLLEKLAPGLGDASLATPESRRAVRAIWALEISEQDTARDALAQLAAGAADLSTTRLAKAALARLAGGPAADENLQPRLAYQAVPRVRSIELDGRALVAASLTNEGDSPVAIYWDTIAYDDVFVFTFQRESGAVHVAETARRYPPFGAMELASIIELPPGRTVGLDVSIVLTPARNAQRFYFRTPGRLAMEASSQLPEPLCTDPTTGLRR
jgi:hypothetical protein